jgi:hypothetical protein
MRRRGLRRFVLEVLFLAGVAVAVTVAELRPVEVIVLMALAWIVVALLEWTAWLDEPHYGRGLPPRYYVPQVALPPPRAVEQGGIRYPVAPRPVARPRSPEPDVEDAPTFERPAAEWGAQIAEWPVLDTSASEETMISISDEVEADAPSGIVPLPPLVGIDETVEHRFDLEDDEEPTVDPEQEREGRDAAVAAGARPATAPDRERFAVPAPERPRTPVQLPVPVRVESVTQHRIDPLASSGRRRFLVFGGGGGEESTLEVPDGPPLDRAVPQSVLEQARAAQR